ncbi:hypothetical protein ABZ419_02315 [Streptomyces cinnamoneus]|uniref:hypothetical protein n=1 Tax=Streptomyces cinnamoneus TaxID=53446 RepID=UPI0033F44ADB
MTLEPLVVPIVVDALFCPTSLLKGRDDAMRSWTPDPNATKGPRAHTVPEADGVTGTNLAPSQFLGVYVQWRLPRALLTRAPADSITGTPPLAGLPDLRGYPLVPNRWLITRYSRPVGQAANSLPKAKSWIIHSDHLDTSTGITDPRKGPLIPHPTRKTTAKYGYPPAYYPYAANLGRLFDLSDPVQLHEAEQAPVTQPGFLTALGPGLPSFAHFHPYHNNVFSFRDSATDLNLMPKDKPCRLSYLVIGWYAHRGDDILAGTRSTQDILASLGWVTAHPGQETARVSLYAGTVLGLPYHPEGGYGADYRDAPPSRCPKEVTKDITVSLGATAADSATAGRDDQDLWRSLAHGWLLDDEPLTQADHDVLAHAARFRTSQMPAGFRWTFTDLPGKKPTPDTAAEDRFLDRLNTVQHTYDRELQTYLGLLHQLHGTWLLSGRTTEPGAYREQLKTGSGYENTLLSRALAQHTRLFGDQGLARTVPWEDPQDKNTDPKNLKKTVTAYEQAHGRHLACSPLPPFHRPQPTALSITNLNGDPDRTAAGPLTCRLLSDLHIPNPADLPPGPPPLTNTPAEVTATLPRLLDEFRALDVASASGQLPPASSLPPYTRLWEQPWQPLFVTWTIRVTPLPYRTGTQQHWTYDNAANRYRWNGTKDYATPPEGGWKGFDLSGVTFLDPVYPSTLAGRAAQLAATHTSAAEHLTPDVIQDLKTRDILTIPLAGLPEALLRRTPGQPLRPPANGDAPGPQLATLFGASTDPGAPPRHLALYTPPTSPRLDGPQTFTPVRAAQITIHALEVVDRFGHSLPLTSPKTYKTPRFTLVIDRALTPDPARLAQDESKDHVAELQPRLAVGARLRFDGIDAHTTNSAAPVVIDPDHGWDAHRNPVCGWIMLSRLGTSLLLYSHLGQGLGELRAVRRNKGTSTVFQPLPDSPYPTLDTPGFARDLPHLHAFTTAFTTRDGRCLTSLLGHLDHTDLATGAATPAAALDARHLALLTGRPLALLRTRLRLETDNLAPTTPKDVSQLADPPRTSPADIWHVRLGNPGQTGDGLAGYFTDGHLCLPGYQPMDTHGQPLDPSGYLTSATGSELTFQAHPVTGDRLATVGYRATPTSTDLHLTILADPFAPLHAHTPLLPSTPLTLPARYLTQAFHALTAAFPLSPLLAPALPETGQHTTALVVPRPSWSVKDPWTQHPRPPATAWPHYPLIPYTPATVYNTPPPEAHTGYLTLTVPLADTPT